MTEIIAEWKKILVAYIARLCFLPFHIFRIKKTRVMFTSLTGGNYMEYSCNPKYIYEYLRDYAQGKYEIIWAVSQPEKYGFLSENVCLVSHFSIQCFYYLLTSKVVITNGSYVPWMPFRKGQTVLNTWHGGGAYKKLDIGNGYLKHLIDKRNALAGKNTSVFVTSSDAFCQYVIRGAFCFRGEVLSCGMPRNDFLVKEQTQEARKKVEVWCEIEGKKILLYAPTYRKNGNYKKLDMNRTIELLTRLTGQTWVCLERLHRYEAGESEQNGSGRIINVNEYPDMQELLGAADMLITDYSSSIWDYSFLERPCFLYVPDLERYRRARGFYEDIETWQYPYATDYEQLYHLIADMEEYDWHAIAKKHHDKLKSCETGHAAETVVEYIEDVCRK